MRRHRIEVDSAIARVIAGATAAECETTTLDFKEDKASTSDMERLVVEAAICFANSAGGAIIIGVSDKIRGAAALTGTEIDPDILKRRIYELTRPNLLCEVEQHTIHRTLLCVHVTQSPEIHADTRGRAFQRINTDCLPMLPDQITRLREERLGIDWSGAGSRISPNRIPDEVLGAARAILSAFNDDRRGLAALSKLDLLGELNVLAAPDELTRAGSLLFVPATEDLIDHIVYQFKDTPGGEARSAHRLGTPLLLSFARVLQLVRDRQTLTPVTLPNGQQITIEDFPSLAIREALSNALCHRDYHMNAPIAVEHSPQVFTITSPGPLVSGVTLENIITTPSRPRNHSLARAARILGLAEEFGRGVDRMYREMIRSGRGVPVITSEFDKVRVALVGGAPDTNIARFVSSLPEAERDDTDTMLVLFRLCSRKTVDAYSITSFLQKSPEEAEAVLRRLSAGKTALIERTRGVAGKGTPSYRLRGEIIQDLGSAVTYQRRTTDEVDRKVISHVQDYGKITNRTLQNFLDVHVYKARDILSGLVQRGVLVRISPQARGPSVEWGPGMNFPVAKSCKRRARLDKADAS